MCIVKTPKVTTTETKVKEPTVIRNPYLDGPSPTNKALRAGRNGLRIERSSGQRSPSTTPVAAPLNPSAPAVTPTVPVGGGEGVWANAYIRRNPNERIA